MLIKLLLNNNFDYIIIFSYYIMNRLAGALERTNLLSDSQKVKAMGAAMKAKRSANNAAAAAKEKPE